MLKENAEHYKEGGEAMITTVECPYCHQKIMAEINPEADTDDKEQMRQLAVKHCTCPGAKYEATRLMRREKLDRKLNEMFGEGSNTPLPEETLEAVKKTALQICFELLDKATISINEKVKVIISIDKNGMLNIKKEIKQVSKQTV